MKISTSFKKKISFSLLQLKNNFSKFILNVILLFLTLISVQLLIGYRYAFEKTLYTLTKYNNNIGDFTVYKNNPEKLTYGPNLYANAFDLINESDIAKINKIYNELDFSKKYKYFFMNSTFSILSNGEKSFPKLIIGIDNNFFKFAKQSEETRKWIPYSEFEEFKNKDGLKLTPTGLQQYRLDKKINLSEEDKQFSGFGKNADGYVNAINLMFEGKFTTGNSILDLRNAITTSENIESFIEKKLYNAIPFYSINTENIIEKDISDINEKFKQQGLPLSAISQKSKVINPIYFGTLSFVDSLIITFSEFIIITGLIGFLSISFIIFLGRKKDIGILEVLGFKKKDIRLILIIESLALSIPTSVLTLSLFNALSFFINKMNFQYQALGFGGNIPFKVILPFSIQIGIVLIFIFFFVLSQLIIGSRILNQPTLEKINDKEG